MADGGPWQGRVEFAPGGGLAFRPGELLVREPVAPVAQAALADSGDDDVDVGDELLGGEWIRLTGVTDPLRRIQELRRVGVAAQVNNVLFATACCPPHPSNPRATPPSASPFYASPFYASPFYASPFYASAAGGDCCCSCCGGRGAAASPFYASPFYASPFYASPFYASADPNPAAAPWIQATGRRRSSARPAAQPEDLVLDTEARHDVRIAILDTGYAETNVPGVLPGIRITSQGGDRPDEDGDKFLDPAAGHGTFIAGVIEQITPGCGLEVIEVLSTYGDGDEATIGQTLFDLATRRDDERPHLVNLSFGGYTPLAMDLLADAIRVLHGEGSVVVASAGNDGTCVPMYPAALPAVVGVGALDEDGNAATFTNYGPWVRASTLGVDVVSSFFEGFNGAEPLVDGRDADDFHGWARWSGTSFSAPRVVAALARRVIKGRTPRQAVLDVVDGEQLERKPLLGTIVLP